MKKRNGADTSRMISRRSLISVLIGAALLVISSGCASRRHPEGRVTMEEAEAQTGSGTEDQEARRPGSPRLVLTLLAVEDLARSVRFYRRAFDWPVAIEVPVMVQFEVPGGGALGVYEKNAFGANTGQVPDLPRPGSLAGTELYFLCDDPAEASARIEAAGARLLSPLAPRPWGDEAAYYADPDGNVLAVARPLPRDE